MKSRNPHKRRLWLPDSEGFRTLLIRRLLETGISQHELAAEAGVNRVAIGHFVTKGRNCTMNWGSKIWEALHRLETTQKKGGTK